MEKESAVKIQQEKACVRCGKRLHPSRKNGLCLTHELKEIRKDSK